MSAHPPSSKPSEPAPASMKGFLILLGALALLAAAIFLGLGDSWLHWFPKE